MWGAWLRLLWAAPAGLPKTGGGGAQRRWETVPFVAAGLAHDDPTEEPLALLTVLAHWYA